VALRTAQLGAPGSDPPAPAGQAQTEAHNPAAKRAAALQPAMAPRAARHSHHRTRQAPPSPMNCPTRTGRSPDEPHLRHSVSGADEHAHPTTRNPTGSATTRLSSRTPKQVAVPTPGRPHGSPHSLESPASQIRQIRTTVRILWASPKRASSPSRCLQHDARHGWTTSARPRRWQARRREPSRPRHT
jgi:hypothetical protein